MRKHMIVLAVLALALTLGTMTARAQVTLGVSSSSVNFFNNADGTANVRLGTCNASFTCTLTGSAAGTPFSDSGTYTFTITNDNTTIKDGGLLAGGLVPPSTSLHAVMANGTATSFGLSFADGDTLSASVVWQSINNGSPQPRFNFALTGITATGDAAWTSIFAGVSTASGDFTLNPMTCNISPCTLGDILASGSTSATGGATVSSGQVITPEPRSLLLLGTGLLCFGGFLRRRIVGVGLSQA